MHLVFKGALQMSTFTFTLLLELDDNRRVGCLSNDGLRRESGQLEKLRDHSGIGGSADLAEQRALYEPRRGRVELRR